MTLRILLAAPLAAASCAPLGVQGDAEPLRQASCLARDGLQSWLDREYAEAPVAVGLADSGAVMEIYAAKDGATWTAALTWPSGLSCVVAKGEAFETLLGTGRRMRSTNAGQMEERPRASDTARSCRQVFSATAYTMSSISRSC